MRSVTKGACATDHIARIVLIALMVLLCPALTGCKKDQTQTEAGDDLSPASVIPAPPGEIDPAESVVQPPSAEMKGLSIHTIPAPADSPILPMPAMKPANGTDMTVRVSHRMAHTPGWTRHFPEFYNAVSDCLDQVEGGGAYAANINHDSQTLQLLVVGLDNYEHECRIPISGGPALSITAVDTQKKKTGPLFFPRSAGKPLIDNPECFIMEAVVARPGGLIGWLAFDKPDCAIK